MDKQQKEQLSWNYPADLHPKIHKPEEGQEEGPWGQKVAATMNDNGLDAKVPDHMNTDG